MSSALLVLTGCSLERALDAGSAPCAEKPVIGVAMPNNESRSELRPLLPELIRLQQNIRDLEAKKTAIEERIMTGLFGSPYSASEIPAENGDDELTEGPELAEKLTPRLVKSAENERAAVQFAGTVMDALVKYFAVAEELILSESGKIRVALRQEVEAELRDNLERSVQSLSTRLEQQQEEQSSLRALTNTAVERLNRHTLAIRSVSDVQVRHASTLRQIAEALKRLAALAETPLPQMNAGL